MIITVVCDVLGKENNGTTIAAMNLIRYLKSRGHEVRVICPDEDKKDEPGYYVVPRLKLLPPLESYVKKVGVTIALSDEKVLMDAIADADAVHIMTPFILGIAGLRCAKKCGKKVTAGFHCQAENLNSHMRLMNVKPVNDLTYKTMYDLFYKNVDAIHYPTQFIRDVFEQETGCEVRAYVISNGVNERFVRRDVEKPDDLKDKFVILSSGRFAPEKSQGTIIDAIKQSLWENKIQLILAGAGPMEEELREKGKALANPPIMKFFTREEILDVINYSDLYVHAAVVDLEAIACLEAISCGLVPVIADSPRCATKGFAIGEHNLFRFGDPRSLREQIDYWIDHPDEKRACADQYVNYTRQFEQSRCMEQMEAMIREVAGMDDNCALEAAAADDASPE